MESIDKETLKQHAFSFLRQQHLGFIATVAKDNTPESACVNYFLDDDWVIYVLTNKDSRKVQNIAQNPHVSFAVAVANIPNTTQIQADAEIIEDANPAYHAIYQKLIDSKVLILDPLYDVFGKNYVILKLKITWLRWLYFDHTTGKEVYTILIP